MWNDNVTDMLSFNDVWKYLIIQLSIFLPCSNPGAHTENIKVFIEDKEEVKTEYSTIKGVLVSVSVQKQLSMGH